MVDERNRFKPPGIVRFARSKGGHLHDDPREGRFATVGLLETWVYEFAAIEQGGMLQNLALMTQAVGRFPALRGPPVYLVSSSWFPYAGDPLLPHHPRRDTDEATDEGAGQGSARTHRGGA